VEPKVKVEDIKEVVPTPDSTAVVVKAKAVVEGKRTELEIAVTTDLAAKMAIALLATTAEARLKRDDLIPALDVFAAGRVASASKELVRVHLVFEQGTVLPLEMTIEAAAALHRSLDGALEGAPSP